MALIKWRPLEVYDPWRALEDLQGEMNRLFDLSLPRAGKNNDLAYPAVDIHEDESNIYVEADLPGFEQKDIKVNFKDDNLYISALRDEKKEEKKKNYHRLERFQGRFERVIPFAKKVKADKIKGRYKKGVLSVTLPKAQEEKAKEVEISIE